MLRTLTMMAARAIAPPASAGRVRLAPSPASIRHAIPVGNEAWPAPITLSPWGEATGLAALAVVTTEPFPPGWWRRLRNGPAPMSPFLRHQLQESMTERPSLVAGTAGARTAAEPRQLHASPPFAAATSGMAAVAIDRHGAPARDRRRLFARVCLFLAGALISFIVVDAASGHVRVRGDR